MTFPGLEMTILKCHDFSRFSMTEPCSEYQAGTLGAWLVDFHTHTHTNQVAWYTFLSSWFKLDLVDLIPSLPLWLSLELFAG